jgi:phosphoglycolate phosphatase
MLRQATIVFDLDGTLVDTAPDLSNALNDVMTRRGHAPVPAATVRACVGHGARVMIDQALRQAGAADDIDQMLAEFLIHYEANIAAESRPFPGAGAALESLVDQGATLAVCTNKREYLSRKLLHELDLAHYFSGLAGRDTFGFSKPDPRHLTEVIALAGGEPSRAIMVGDSEVEAQAAAIPMVLVSFGYANGPFKALQAEARIDHFDELEAHVASLLNGLSPPA